MSVVAMLEGAAEADSETLSFALALAQKMQRPLTGLCALPDPLSALMVVSTPEMAGLPAVASQSILEMQKDILAQAEGAFRRTVGSAAGGHTFEHVVATSDAAAVNAATLAEALVFSRRAVKAGSAMSIAFDHVLMEARLPVVLAGTKPFAPGPVVIGWDGSNGAARAVRFHAGLIAAMGEAVIAHNPKDAGRESARPSAAPAVLADWLERQGVKVRSETLSGDVGAGLLSLAGRLASPVIVAGAYGHSRLAERMFGGTSRNLLEAADAPALALAR